MIGLPELEKELVQVRAQLHSARQRLAAQQAVTRILSEAVTFDEAAPQIIKAICESTGWDLGAIWRPDPSTAVLHCVDLWHSPAFPAKPLVATGRKTTFAPGVGLAGRVWVDQAPLWVADVTGDSRFSGKRFARAYGLRGAVAVPIRVGEELIGVIELLSWAVRPPDTELLEMLAALGSQIGQFSEQRRAEEALRESEERYALAARGANDGLWDWNLKTGRIYFSPRWKYMLGCGESEIGDVPREWFDRVHPEDVDGLTAALMAHTEGRVPHFEHELRVRHQDGSYRWMLSRALAVRDDAGKATRIAGSQTDITARKLAEERLLHDAFHDALTGLRNRTLFIDRLARCLRRARHTDGPDFAVLFLDLDRFKVVNDSLGHLVGDQLLMAIARRLESCLRPSDTVARLGGDEFAILLDDIRDVTDATRVAERIHRELSQPFQLGGQEVFTTASIGIAVSASHYERADDLLRDADMAMYRAKALGKARHEMYDTDMHARAVEVLQLESDLRRAVEGREFLVYYQPIVSLASGKLTGIEALLRWQHPQRGTLPAAEFLPLAEETGLIVPIGEWLLRTACGQVRQWQNEGHPELRVLINLSARQFQDPYLPGQIARVLEETGVAPAALQLEITESVAMRNIELSLATLEALHKMGVGISIDDFGTGYSSLSYLKRLPLDALKIDHSFVQHVTTNADDAAITESITGLAHSLGLKVIAEGVETAEQLAFLRSRRCDEIQGHLISPPLPAEPFTCFLRDSRSLFATESLPPAPLPFLAAFENRP
jgi:diguanylate cyclase (GGDEF)-like protein/PAS domain S-box-containing protein